jgi:phytoene synthase
VSLKSPNRLALSPQVGIHSATQPLPAEEQLALLFHLADTTPTLPPASDSLAPARLSLAESYHFCEQVIRQHSKSFFFSSQFLPGNKRHAVRALYAFCRSSDDAVDMAEGDPARSLAAWVHKAQAPVPPVDDPVLIAWHDTRTSYNLSTTLINELLAGVAMDLTINRYATFADLWLYCYRVASVVGLLSVGIIGSAPGAEPYAIKLGVALQLTNILRDVGEDVHRGRVYLPQEDMERFGLTDTDILQGVYDERFRALMRFEVARTHQLYEESWPGIALLPPDSRLAIGAAARVYRGILDKISSINYNVFQQRAYLTLWDKCKLLPVIWRAVRQLRHRAAS